MAVNHNPYTITPMDIIFNPDSLFKEALYLKALEFNRNLDSGNGRSAEGLFVNPNLTRTEWDRLVADKFTIGELRRINPYDDPPGTYDYIFHDGDTEEVRRQTPRPANWLDIYSSPPEN